MMLLLRVLSRLTGMLMMLVLALVGLGLALYCLDGLISLGAARPDRLLGLLAAREHVGHFLNQLGAEGPTARLALLCGLAAMALGIILLLGTLRSSRRRVAVMDTLDGGTLAARPRALRTIARALAQRAEGATSISRARIALSRRGTRGRLKVDASRASTSDRHEVENAIKTQLEPISEPFSLQPRVRVRVGEAGERVQ
jgi:hypothetical protein